MTYIRKPVDADDVVERYLAGASVNKLAKELGVSRNVIERRLDERGIERRGRSEAERVKWSSFGPERRRQQVAAANAASRGRPKSAAMKRRAARTNYLRRTRRGKWEDRLADALMVAGLDVEQQLAVDCYNLDIAVQSARVAVEVQSDWPKTSSTTPFAERTKCLLSRGWALLYVDCTNRIEPDVGYVTEKALALVNSARRGEPVHGRYWVIRGDAKDPAGMRAKLHKLTGVESADCD